MLSKEIVTIHARLSSRTNGIVPMSNLFLFARKRDFIVQPKGIQSFMHSKSISFGPDLSQTIVGCDDAISVLNYVQHYYKHDAHDRHRTIPVQVDS